MLRSRTSYIAFATLLQVSCGTTEPIAEPDLTGSWSGEGATGDSLYLTLSQSETRTLSGTGLLRPHKDCSCLRKSPLELALVAGSIVPGGLGNSWVVHMTFEVEGDENEFPDDFGGVLFSPDTIEGRTQGSVGRRPPVPADTTSYLWDFSIALTRR